MITVKKSITRVLVSVFAAVVMVITSIASVFAENDYASQSTDCSNKTNWSEGSVTGCTISISDGILKSERTIFRTSKPSNYITGATDVTSFVQYVDGVWTVIGDADSNKTSNPSAIYKFSDSKSFTKGVMQAKFDVMFGGGSGQAVRVGMAGSCTTSWQPAGIIIRKDRMTALHPSGGETGAVYYNNDRSDLVDNTWYTFTVRYDIAAEKTQNKMSYTVEEKGTGTVMGSGSAVIDKWSSYSEGPVTGVSFASMRDFDHPSADSATKSSIWYIDNVEIDAYSASNYKLENVYKSDDGLMSNKASEGIPFRGIALTRLTNIADPANASLVTASYDADTRMENVLATPLSGVGTTPIHSTVTGNTVKSFILNMDTANPYIDAYQYTTPETTERWVDFNDGYVLSKAKLANITTQGYRDSDVGDLAITTDNGALKFERSVFYSGEKGYKWDGEAAIEGGSTSNNTNYVVKLGEDVTSVSGSMKFKFAGVDNESGNQQIVVDIGSGTGNPGEYLIRIDRADDGSGSIQNFFSTHKVLWSAGAMKENEWYTLNFSYAYNGSADDATLTATVTGDFGNGTEKKGFTDKKPSSDTVKASFDYVAVYSHRTYDYAFKIAEATTPTTGWKTRTSVWWIDDLKLEY